MVFFLSLFATNMTAFAILGSSGLAYRRGIGIYGLMASSSGFVIPLTIFFIGTRLWALGKRFGHQTQVQFFRDRWECDGIGTVIFALSAAMLIPYMIISIMGGGTVLQDISTAKGAHDAADSLLARLRDRGGGGDGERLLRRHARDGLGQYFSNDLFLCFGVVAVVGHQPCTCPAASANTSPSMAADPEDKLPRHARTDAADGILELHAHPAFLDHVSAHGDHVLLGAQGDRVQAHGRHLSHRHHG